MRPPPLPRDVAPNSSITTTMTINTSSAHPHKTYLYRLRLIRFSLDAAAEISVKISFFSTEVIITEKAK